MNFHIVHSDPAQVNYHPALTPPNICLGVRDFIYSNLERIDRPNKQKLHNFNITALTIHNSHRTLPAPEPHPASA